jgi:hypothetical protein
MTMAYCMYDVLLPMNYKMATRGQFFIKVFKPRYMKNSRLAKAPSPLVKSCPQMSF